MEIQDTRDSRREMQTLQEVMAQQGLALQRLERSLKRLEESQDKIASRLDAIESARPGTGAVDTLAATERNRPGAAGNVPGPSAVNREGARERVSRIQRNPAAAQASGGDGTPSGSNGPAQEEGGRENCSQAPDPSTANPNLLSRAKVALRAAIADGTVGATLNKVQSSLKLADEATGALAEISTIVRSSLTEGRGLQGSGLPPIPVGSWTLLLDLAKTPQFQRFVAGLLTQFLKDPDLDTPASVG